MFTCLLVYLTTNNPGLLFLFYLTSLPPDECAQNLTDTKGCDREPSTRQLERHSSGTGRLPSYYPLARQFHESNRVRALYSFHDHNRLPRYPLLESRRRHQELS